MKYVGIAVWVALAVYCFFCIWFSEIRFIYWKGTDAKIGIVGYFAATLFLWSPLLAFFDIIPDQYGILLYVVMLIAFIIACVGYLVDAKKL
ncbi:MAG TPA: hypothetical protein VFI24_00790 [Pyrinomonadaceae bacterium]|nr:hypothetical protein [Pyrinomonadaceae bacterium]